MRQGGRGEGSRRVWHDHISVTIVPLCIPYPSFFQSSALPIQVHSGRVGGVVGCVQVELGQLFASFVFVARVRGLTVPGYTT